MLFRSWAGPITTVLSLFFFSLISSAADVHYGLELHQTQDTYRYLWTSVNIYDKNTVFSDTELMGMARAAYQEMTEEQKKLTSADPRWRRRVPGVMAVLAVVDPDPNKGLNVVLVSSLKGSESGTSFILADGRVTNPARTIVDICQEFYEVSSRIAGSSNDPRHKTDSHCAEPMALYAYYEIFQDSKYELGKARETPRFAVWGWDGRTQDLRPLDPCSYFGAEIYGCQQLFREQNVRSISSSVTPTPPTGLKQPTVRDRVCVFPENIRGECCTNGVFG
ncbi:hypothetical protein MMC34_004993 [Xylographa carneopallida]|nr:hypothetical protein [Xylographa carneopallida]